MSSTIRFKFSRKGPVKYLGHLDMMRYFQKVVMRSKLNVKYSEGFNPHQLMSFAYPLGVSMETEGDYMDLELIDYTCLEEVVESMNSVMNEGIKIVSASVVPENSLNAMASVKAASYEVTLNKSLEAHDIDNLLSMESIVVVKDGKKGPVEKDIRPGIIKLEATDDNTLYMLVSSGSELNIKAVDLINKLGDYAITHLKRIEIYKDDNGQLVPLGVFNE